MKHRQNCHQPPIEKFQQPAMKLRAASLFVLLLSHTLVYAEAYLCGDPPVVSNELKNELDKKAQTLSTRLSQPDLKENIQAARRELLSKYPDADGTTIGYYLLYQTCAAFTSSTNLAIDEQANEIRKMRTIFHDALKSQIAYGKCRHKDFGQEGWARSETIKQSSGWLGGGSNPTNWCYNLINTFIQGRSIGPDHEATILNTYEEGKWTWDRQRLYNYHCTIRMQWIPIYNEKTDPRCGVEPK